MTCLLDVSAQGLILFQGKIVFLAKTNAYGYELWQWDEVNAPTLIGDISPSNPGVDAAPVRLCVET